MMRRNRFLKMFTNTALALLVPSYVQAQTIVSGVTYKLDGKGGYTSLPGVSITAIREGVGPANSKPIVSDDHGHFELQLPEGAPFLVLFYGDQRVPQLQQLAGNRTKDVVHITLYTPREYEELHPGGLALNEVYHCLEKAIPQKSEASQILRKYLDGLQRR